LSNTESQIRASNGGGGGVIRVSTECYTCYHWLPPVLRKFHARFPKVEVAIDADATADPAAALLEGRLDVAVMSSLPRNKSLQGQPMFEDELVLVMSSDHPLASVKELRPRDLAGETVLIYPPREESVLLNSILAPAGVEPARVIEVPLTEVIIELAAAGTGIGMLAHWAVAPHVERGRLAVQRIGGGVRRNWHGVTLRDQPTSRFLPEFLNLLSAFCPKQAKRISA